MISAEELQSLYEEKEADLDDVERAMTNLVIQPGKNAVWMRVGYTNHNCIGRVPAAVLLQALTFQRISLQNDLYVMACRLGKKPPAFD